MVKTSRSDQSRRLVAAEGPCARFRFLSDYETCLQPGSGTNFSRVTLRSLGPGFTKATVVAWRVKLEARSRASRFQFSLLAPILNMP